MLLQLLALTAFGQQLPKPQFSVTAGYYADSVVLAMTSPVSGTYIRYTLNGSEPSANSPLYTAPLILKDRSRRPNGISTIPTNPSFGYPKNGYDSLRAQTRGWLPPYDTILKVTMVKARLFKGPQASDSTAAATYFIRPGGGQPFSLPVLSIGIDSASLFAYTDGIYVYGADSLNEGNYSADTSYRKAHIEFFESDGHLAFGQYMNLRIHGNGGRHAPQKSLLLKAEKEFGKSSVEHRLFAGSALKTFDKLLLRNSGHRPDCIPRDDIGLDFLASLGNLAQHNRHCIVLINGEYWGVQTLKEVFDDNYFKRAYNIPKGDCVVLTQAGSIDEGQPGDEQSYAALMTFLSANNMALPKNYAYAATQMDLESFTNFECGEIFLGNGDWPNNNTKFWRYKGTPAGNQLDGRWRWLFYDLDAAFGGDCSGIYPSFNTLIRATDPSYGTFTKPLRSLLTNPEYKIYFINRYADLLNSNFLPSQLTAAINRVTATMQPEMPAHVSRWRYPSVSSALQARASEVPSLSKWNSIRTGLLNFANQRSDKTRRHFMNYFMLPDTFRVTLDVDDTLRGRIRINSLYLDRWLIRNNSQVYPWSGVYFNGNPVSIEAIAYPGYRFAYWNATSDTTAQLFRNIYQDTSLTAHFVKDTAFRAWHYLYINELMASNSSNITDDYLEHEDWVELYNPNAHGVDVSGFYLSDDPLVKTKYRLRTAGNQTSIPPHGFLLAWADDDAEQGSLHCNFRLNKSGGHVLLTLPDGVHAADSIGYGPQKTDTSFGRRKDGSTDWVVFEMPTPKASNHLQETPEPENFLVYPNPAGDELFFTRTADVTVYDVMGKLVLSAQQARKLNLSPVAAGLYFLRTSQGQCVKFVRL